MRKLLAVILFALLAFSFSAEAQRAGSTLRRTVKKLYDAMVSADSTTMDNLVLPVVVYVHSSGKVEGKIEFIGKILSGASDFVSIELSDESVTVSEKTAIVRHTLKGVTNDNGKPGNIELRIMQVWQKTKGGWRLLARQSQRAN